MTTPKHEILPRTPDQIQADAIRDAAREARLSTALDYESERRKYLESSIANVFIGGVVVGFMFCVSLRACAQTLPVPS